MPLFSHMQNTGFLMTRFTNHDITTELGVSPLLNIAHDNEQLQESEHIVLITQTYPYYGKPNAQ